METELKYALSAESLLARVMGDSWIASLRQEKNWQQIDMISWYLDTGSLWLAARSAALRLRLENKRLFVVIKQGKSGDGGLHQRQEWSMQLDEEITPAAFLARPGAVINYAFKDIRATADLKNILDYLQNQQLEIIAKMRFQRQKGNLRYKNTLLEIAFDRGNSECGSRIRPILEIELELISGKLEYLLELGRLVQEKYALQPETRSKLERCRAAD